MSLSVFMAVGSETKVQAASLCSRSTWPVITGDWTVTQDELCEGTVYTMTGNLAINAGATLTLKNGGIKFLQTPVRHFSIQVTGTLVLDNSIITVTPGIDPYLKLVFQSSGTVNMIHDSILQFPGWLNTTSGTFVMDHSTITGLSTTDVSKWVADYDDNDDAPAMTFSSTVVQLYDSSIFKLYEKVSVADSRRSINLVSGTNFLAINTHLDIDFGNTSIPAMHNTIGVAAPSAAYLLWPTVDVSENPPYMYQYSNPIEVTGGASAYVYRRVDATVVDLSGAPVNGAAVAVTYSGTQTAAQYPDNGGLTSPSTPVTQYLAKLGAQFAITNQAGLAIVPLVSDMIDTSGIHFWGNYNVTATSGSYVGRRQISLAHWPESSDADNQIVVTIQLDLVRPRPDIWPSSMIYTPTYPKVNQTVTITITVANIGSTSAINILARVYDNVVAPTALIYYETVPFIANGGTANLKAFTWNPQTGGTHLVVVVVDPLDTILEENEGNNVNSFPLPVTPLGPDLVAYVGAMTGFAGNPVTLNATISNIGDTSAKQVTVSFYVGSLNTIIGTIAPIPEIPANSSTPVGLTWVPPSVGVYMIFAWVDPDNVIPESPPYSETNNQGSNNLTVVAAPNPTSYSDEVGAVDPYPRIGTSVQLSAVVRNIGQADVTQPFNVAFSVDGTKVGTDQQVASPLRIGDKQTVTSSASWTPPAGSCGYHTLRVDVDNTNVIAEGAFYEADNLVTRFLQVYHPGYITYPGDLTLQYLPVFENIEITGHLTIENGFINVTEPQEACGRVYIKVMPGGTLTLINSTLMARDNDNWPLVVYVGGRLEASQNSKLLLNTNQGDGIIEVGGSGIIELADTTVVGDISAHGASATFNRVVFRGDRLHADTSGATKIWDPVFQGTSYLALRSDDKVGSTVDVDLRNATLDGVLTNQLVFGGHQWAHLTDVVTTKTTRWWEGTITQKAKVTRHWWLTLKAVDGTGAPLRSDANATLTLSKLNVQTLQYVTVPSPTRGDEIFGSNISTPNWPISAPNGVLLYKAPSEDRFASVESQWMNATYRLTGTAVINGTLYYPDENVTGFVGGNTVMTITFSKLTPDLRLDAILFSGQAGPGALQPLNRQLTITAIVGNSGEIDVPVVWVYFYSADVSSPTGYPKGDNISLAPYYIGCDRISVGRGGTGLASIDWNPPTTTYETTVTISAIVDPPLIKADDGGRITETNEKNNVRVAPLTMFVWPDLHLEAGQVHVPDFVQGNPATILVDVRNDGTNEAKDARVELRVDGSPTPISSNPIQVPKSGTATAQVVWTPPSVGQHNLTFTAVVFGSPRNIDYNLLDNTAQLQVTVGRPPDLAVNQGDYANWYNMTQGGKLVLPVRIYNNGDADAPSFMVGVFVRRGVSWPPAPEDQIASRYDLSLAARANNTFQITVQTSTPIAPLGQYQFTIYVDSARVIIEDNEANNAVNVTVNVIPPTGTISLSTDIAGKTFEPGKTITILGQVLTTGATQDPIPNIGVNATLRDSRNFLLSTNSTTTDVIGVFALFLSIPGDTPNGDYTVQIFSPNEGITQITATITVQKVVPWWMMSIFGLPLWLFLLIIIIIVVVVVGIVAYTRVVGLGKMVECGECGAFIPEDSTKCPKCGVEFEKDMAKCSNCQAWIPLDVKQCPECNVEFATGEIEMADYEKKMKTQYEEVKAKFRRQAEAEIGRPLSDREFEDWWRRQPTFLTFEDWLHEEEDMRKMGSKPCPTCETLNSITATVCHRCGTLLKKEERKAKPPPKAPPKEEARREEAAEAEEPRPTEPVPKKIVVKKPVMPTVVQKKVVVKRPPEEGGTGTEGEGSGESEI